MSLGRYSPALLLRRAQIGLAHWRVKRAFDLNDVVLVEPVHFDDCARRIGSTAPQFRLYPINKRPIAEHIGDIDDKPHGILQCRPFQLGYQLHVYERLADARFVALDQSVGLGIDATHSRDIYKVARAGSKVPCSGRLDCAGRRQRLDAMWRNNLCQRRPAEQGRDRSDNELIQFRPPQRNILIKNLRRAKMAAV